jgi:hypothetical protein
MEEHLRRELESNEHVHHKNGIITDNRLENLQLMRNNQHLRITNIGIVRSLESRLKDSVKHMIDMSKRSCFRCGTNKTSLKKTRLGQYRPHWYKLDDKTACMKCYLKQYNKTKRDHA